MFEIKGKTRGLLLITGFLFVVFLLWYFSTIVTYVLISLVLSFIGKPLVRFITRVKYKKISVPKGLAALVVLLMLWLFFIIFFRFMIPLLMSELETFSQIDFDMVIDSIEGPVLQFFQFFSNKTLAVENQSFLDIITEELNNNIDFSKLSNLFTIIAGTIGELLIACFSVSFITFFFLKEENMFREGIILLVPTNLETKVAHILDSISYLLRRYFIGLILEVFMVMLLDTAGLTFVGLEFNHAVIIGLIAGLFNVIPYLGPWMAAAIGLLIGVAVNLNADFMSYTLPLLGFMAVVFGTVQVIDNLLFQPFIYSSSVKAHPLEIFIVILIAGSLAGIIGMILAIPFYTILRVVAKEFFDNMKIVKRLTKSLTSNSE